MAIAYFKRDIGTGGPGSVRFFAVTKSGEPEVPGYTEGRLADGHFWQELDGVPVQGWPLEGDPFLVEVNELDVPVRWSLEMVQRLAEPPERHTHQEPNPK